jgi:hypothetical protein
LQIYVKRKQSSKQNLYFFLFFDKKVIKVTKKGEKRIRLSPFSIPNKNTDTVISPQKP